MGTYLNPGNSGFSDIVRDTYVDKTGLISCINKAIDTPQKLICVSRPRRFGKSFAAKMLCAYYDKSCDSGDLFKNLEIASSPDHEKHLNKYDVIYLDMADLKPFTEDYNRLIPTLEDVINDEICKDYPDVNRTDILPDTLVNTVEHSGSKFVMIIDEWDAPIRENPGILKEYLSFLRSLFKSSRTTDRTFAAVYMTGILPIKKDGSQSALSDFQEYTMLSPAQFSDYVGFTEKEVGELCEKYKTDFQQMKSRYDGYYLRDTGEVYNPNSVMQAIRRKRFSSYWVGTTAIESLMRYISLDYMGLSKTIAELIGGSSVEVDPLGFSNDLVTFKDKDDVLTLLVHLGYLAFDSEEKTARIPNEEIRREFEKAVRVSDHEETVRRVAESDRLIEDTVHMDEEAVARSIQKIHLEETSPLFYNSEQALRGVIKLAYFAYRDYYLRFEELPAGAGFADIVYFPKKGLAIPALLIELKWNKSARGAIDQIKDKQYPDAIRDYGGDVLLVGINYDTEKKTHECRIERLDSECTM